MMLTLGEKELLLEEYGAANIKGTLALTGIVANNSLQWEVNEVTASIS